MNFDWGSFAPGAATLVASAAVYFVHSSAERTVSSATRVLSEKIDSLKECFNAVVTSSRLAEERQSNLVADQVRLESKFREMEVRHGELFSYAHNIKHDAAQFQTGALIRLELLEKREHSHR